MKPNTLKTIIAAFILGLGAASAATPDDGSVLPFPPTPSASKAGPTLQGSVHKRRVELSRLPDHTVVLYLTMFQDATGAYFSPRQALALFAPASRAPTWTRSGI
jgi:hypothetical protein